MRLKNALVCARRIFFTKKCVCPGAAHFFAKKCDWDCQSHFSSKKMRLGCQIAKKMRLGCAIAKKMHLGCTIAKKMRLGCAMAKRNAFELHTCKEPRRLLLAVHFSRNFCSKQSHFNCIAFLEHIF